MRILVAAESLGTLGGVETYALTVAEQFQRLGHQVAMWGIDHGDASDRALKVGLRVLSPEGDSPEPPDAILVQDAIAALRLADLHPRVPQVFVAHSDVYDKFLPPQVPGVIAAVVTLYDRVDRRVRAMAVPTEILRLTQPIDTDRFRSLRPLPDRPTTALALGHYVFGERLELLRRACGSAGIELRHAGVQTTPNHRPVELQLNDVDIVFGKARVIYEAMACGRAAYVYDLHGGDGWVTGASYPRLAADNFGGRNGEGVFDEARLQADLASYDASMGLVHRDLVLRHHTATAHVAALVDLLRRVAARERPLDAPLDELARITRVMHRADAWAVLHQGELIRLAGAEQELRAVATHMAGHADELTERLLAAEARARRADARAAAAEQSLAALTSTRRWRAIQRCLRPLDRIRRRG
jgi:hypothetical protein